MATWLATVGSSSGLTLARDQIRSSCACWSFDIRSCTVLRIPGTKSCAGITYLQSLWKGRTPSTTRAQTDCAEEEGGTDEEGLATTPISTKEQVLISHRISTERVRSNAARATRCALALGGQVGGGFNPASHDALALFLAPPDPMGQGTRRAHIKDALVNPVRFSPPVLLAPE